MSDPFDLNRFLQAQEPVLTRVRQELEDGRKRSHWMWFVFPQLIGLGHSAMAQRYALASLDEPGRMRTIRSWESAWWIAPDWSIGSRAVLSSKSWVRPTT